MAPAGIEGSFSQDDLCSTDVFVKQEQEEVKLSL
jgi:hypothetical protein